LDFFVMLGSTSAMLGGPTQSNYCAGNSFLEYFARYRHRLGLPATTVSLTFVVEVGFVSQNEAIEDGLMTLGLASLNEAEFIQLMETAMNKPSTGTWKFDSLANNLLVTGLEPVKLDPGMDVDGVPFWREARTGPLLNAVLDKVSGSGDQGSRKKGGKLDYDGVLELIVDKFAKTFNLDVNDVDPSLPIVSFGMDSMIGTSLRTWTYKQLGAEIPSSDL